MEEGQPPPSLASDRSVAPDDELGLVDALRSGREDAFSLLVARHQTAMLRVARFYVPSAATAEDVVQETWMAVLRGIDRFAGRSSIKAWMFHILINRAKTAGEREGRTIPFAEMAGIELGQRDASVSGSRFLESSHPSGPHHWKTPPYLV